MNRNRSDDRPSRRGIKRFTIIKHAINGNSSGIEEKLKNIQEKKNYSLNQYTERLS